VTLRHPNMTNMININTNRIQQQPSQHPQSRRIQAVNQVKK